MEVAIKMALRLFDVRSGGKAYGSGEGESGSGSGSGDSKVDVIVLTQRDCYHGDTLGTMDTAESGPFNQSQHPWYRPRTIAIPFPTAAYRRGRLVIDAGEFAVGCDKVRQLSLVLL
jgi:4-aminobutyrate aminotransferase-like enzyme